MVTIVVKKKRNKFGNIHTICHQGHNHPSKGEANQCDILHIQWHHPTSEVRFIHYERSYDLKVNKQLICRHKPDFTLEMCDGTFKVVEYKGRATADWKLKAKLFVALYPEIQYEIVYKKQRIGENRKK